MIDGLGVLIHGFWSSPATWDRLAGVLDDDPDLAGLRWHRYGYESPKLSLPLLPFRIPAYDDIAQALHPFLASVAPDGDLAFVTHSQGGLILQRYLAWMLNEGRARELGRVRSIVMLACPHEGSDYLRSLRAAAGFGRHPQARNLRQFDAAVAATRRTVLNQIVHATTLDDRQCPIPIHVYAGRTDNVVTRVPAQGTFPNAGVLPGDHHSILDPDLPGSLTAATIRNHLIKDFKAGAGVEKGPAPSDSTAVASTATEHRPTPAGGTTPGGETTEASPDPGHVDLRHSQGVQINQSGGNTQHNTFGRQDQP